MIAAAMTALLCLSHNAYYEARGEPYAGQVAVNQVALRRAAFDRDSVCAEIYKPKQFSWTHDTTRPKPRGPAWARAQQAARDALVWAEHGIGPDYSRGATHYHAVHVRPYWTCRARLTVQISRHRFYNRVSPCQR